MNLYLTLDYELFFGKNIGSYKQCLLQSTKKLLTVLDKHSAKAVFFVDALYLHALRKQAATYHCLQQEYQEVVEHVKFLEKSGHEIQLHIHPHWADCSYNGTHWNMNLARYKLSDWDQAEAIQLIKTATQELNSHLASPVFAYRAGGWCIQPFKPLAKTFKEVGIWLDSTVYSGGFSSSPTHYYNFQNAPNKEIWSFKDDPCLAVESKNFIELPIANMKITPWFYWKLVIVKLLFKRTSKFKSYGDGKAIAHSNKDLFRLLFRWSYSVVSLDGIKSSLILTQYQKARDNNRQHFVIIAHPKALTDYSLEKLDQLMSQLDKNSQFTTFKAESEDLKQHLSW